MRCRSLSLQTTSSHATSTCRRRTYINPSHTFRHSLIPNFSIHPIPLSNSIFSIKLLYKENPNGLMESLSYASAKGLIDNNLIKRKRSKRHRPEDDGGDGLGLVMDEVDLDLAWSLMILASGVLDRESVMVKEENVCLEDKETEIVRNVTPPCAAELTAEEIELTWSTVEKGCCKCSVCDKEFVSFQALDGHKANHRELAASGEITNTATALSVTAVEKAESGGVRVHECSICLKQFSTGQALGGHKRRHFKGVLGKPKYHQLPIQLPIQTLKPAANSSSGITTASTSDGAGSSLTQRGFDLNISVLPDLWPVISRFAAVKEEVESPHPANKPTHVFLA